VAEYGKLPHGGDPAIRDANWGISYAFNPILAYMAMAVFRKNQQVLFTSQLQTLVMAATVGERTAGLRNCLSADKAGKILFPKMAVMAFCDARLCFCRALCSCFLM
jgi:hypothetical protein